MGILLADAAPREDAQVLKNEDGPPAARRHSGVVMCGVAVWRTGRVGVHDGSWKRVGMRVEDDAATACEKRRVRWIVRSAAPNQRGRDAARSPFAWQCRIGKKRDVADKAENRPLHATITV